MPTKSEEIKVKAQEDLHSVVTILVGASMMLTPYQYRMTKEDVDRIFIPLENIVIRHTETGALNPDLVDLYLFCIGVVLYVQRTKLVQSTLGNGRLKIKRSSRSNQPTTVAQNPVAHQANEPRPKTTSSGTNQLPTFSDANTALADMYESAKLAE